MWLRRCVAWLLVATVSTGAIGCGRAPILELGEFAPYVKKFEEKSAEVGKPVQVTDLIVEFGPVEERQDAVCETGGNMPPTIIINQNAWDRMDESDREALMFHELGHCVLGRRHLTERNSEGQPASLMYPIALSSDLYVKNRDYYIRELFFQSAG